MKMKVFYTLVFLLLFLPSCATTTPSDKTPVILDIFPGLKFPGVESKPELYQFPIWLDGCDRFRPLFQQELNKYPSLSEVVDLSWLYALVYQETLCQTREELQKQFQKPELVQETWQGGIMQVDGCWRGNFQYDCSTIQPQILLGMKELNFSYAKIDAVIQKLNLNEYLTQNQKLTLLFLAYNRGYYVPEDALKLFKSKLENNSWLMDGMTSIQKEKLLVFVSCPEKDVCTNDQEYIDLTKELSNSTSDFEKALLISCRRNYGFMKNSQGDYCTGPGYGLNYPLAISTIHDSITEYQQRREWEITIEKEFYSGELHFSGYNWFVKTSIGKTGPGPNFFYYDNSSTYTDDKGRLHLNVIEREGRWYSSEVVLQNQLGYGTYSFLVESDPGKLDKNVVLGLFTYDLHYLKEPDYFHREIDIEVSQWGIGNNDNIQFAVQGPKPLQAIERFNLNQTQDLIFVFEWKESKIDFQVIDNFSREVLQQWSYQGELIPKPGDERARINLWIYNDDEPSDGKEEEVIITKFWFKP